MSLLEVDRKGRSIWCTIATTCTRQVVEVHIRFIGPCKEKSLIYRMECAGCELFCVSAWFKYWFDWESSFQKVLILDWIVLIDQFQSFWVMQSDILILLNCEYPSMLAPLNLLDRVCWWALYFETHVHHALWPAAQCVLSLLLKHLSTLHAHVMHF